MRIFISLLIVLAVLFIFLNNRSVYAQWEQCYGIGGTVSSFVILGNNIFAGNHLDGIWLSTNNGQNWTQNGLNDKNVYSLVVLGNIIFAGTNYGVYLSTNNGQNWTQSGLSNKHALSLAVSGNNLFAGTYPSGVLVSTNNGNNWTQTALNDKDVWSLAISDNNIFAGTNYGVYLSTNDGSNWTQTALNDKSVYSLAVSGNNIFAGTYLQGVYLSTNNGSNWTQSGLNGKYVYTFAISGNNVFAGTYPSGVWLSTNNAGNWIEKNEGFTPIPEAHSLLIANDYIFAGTSLYSVWRRLLQNILEIQNISVEIPLYFSLSQNYPNPFNPSSRIKFLIPNSGFVKLTVFDVLGREVTTLVKEQLKPGIYEVEWNAVNYPSGVYYYKLTAGDFTKTKKMILVK